MLRDIDFMVDIDFKVPSLQHTRCPSKFSLALPEKEETCPSLIRLLFLRRQRY